MFFIISSYNGIVLKIVDILISIMYLKLRVEKFIERKYRRKFNISLKKFLVLYLGIF